LKRRLAIGLRVFGFALVVALLVFFIRGIDTHALFAAFRAASPLLIALAALVNVGTVWWKANYWQAMLSPLVRIPLPRLFRYTLASVAGSVVAPGKAGEAVRIWLLKRNHGLPMRLSAGVVAVEKLADVLALLIMVTPLSLVFMPVWLARSLLLLGGLALLIMVTPLSLVFMPVWLARSLLLLGGLALLGCAALWFAATHSLVQDWTLFAGLRLVRQPRVLVRGFACVLASWLSDLAAIWLVIAALGIEAPPAAGMLILLFVNLAVAIPATPAGAGTLELGAMAAFELLGLPRDQGLAFGLLYHGAQVLPILAAGLLAGRRLMAEPAPDPVPALIEAKAPIPAGGA
jgi:uncharacterized protein (TIRG00374 family)